MEHQTPTVRRHYKKDLPPTVINVMKVQLIDTIDTLHIHESTTVDFIEDLLKIYC